MYDSARISHPIERARSIVPLEQVTETRRTFPGTALSFELLISVRDPLAGLAHCATVFARAGVGLLSLKCTAGGRISCRLADRDTADLELLARDLSGEEAQIETWTTVLGCGGT